jgi:hypothetical protein
LETRWVSFGFLWTPTQLSDVPVVFAPSAVRVYFPIHPAMTPNVPVEGEELRQDRLYVLAGGTRVAVRLSVRNGPFVDVVPVKQQAVDAVFQGRQMARGFGVVA